MAYVVLERGRVNDDGSVVFDKHGRRYIEGYDGKARMIPDLQVLVMQWTKRGPEYMGTVYLRDARDYPAPIYMRLGDREWESEILYHAQHSPNIVLPTEEVA